MNDLIIVYNFEAWYRMNAVMFSMSMFDSYFQHLNEPEHSGRRFPDDWIVGFKRLIQLGEWDLYLKKSSV